MNTRKSVIVLILLLLFSAVASLGIRDNFGSEMGFLNDYGDKMVYAVRGSWLPYLKKPYTEVSRLISSPFPMLLWKLLAL
jgi:hypothetical protein